MQGGMDIVLATVAEDGEGELEEDDATRTFNGALCEKLIDDANGFLARLGLGINANLENKLSQLLAMTFPEGSE